MSYCRWSDGDVYMFESVYGYIECCMCGFQDKKWVDDPGYSMFGGYLKNVGPKIYTDFKTRRGALKHLLKHRAAGHDVPQYAIDRLQAEIDAGDLKVKPYVPGSP